MSDPKEIKGKFDNCSSEQDDQYLQMLLVNRDFISECVKKFNDRLKDGEAVTAADIFEELGLDQNSAPNVKFKLDGDTNIPKKTDKPAYKIYENLAYISAMETTRCRMLISKLKAIILLLDAQREFYETLSMLERDNESFGFDLDI